MPNDMQLNGALLPEIDGTEIAIIGMHGRFPGANTIDEFWNNIRNGVESIYCFRDDELLNAGVDQSVLNDPNYVKAVSSLDQPGAFDAAFFGVSYREAELLDPQQRILLECAWSALEDAGCNAQKYRGAIGVFAGATINTYLLTNIATDPTLFDELDPVQINLASAGDFLATRISYKLNLTGPSYTIQSACSTSLVAVHVACENLRRAECDMALAGGVSVNVRLQRGYRYLSGGMSAPDGRCRPFDARAQGTIFGSGGGLVVLKRVTEALENGDTIYALIKGSAINNDGSLKVGYAAPSVDGQAAVIAEALANAGVPASTIDYIEAHGTATPLGDPIEVQALTKAFRPFSVPSQMCAIGSVKSNIGHLDAAAGIAGLIKTVMALRHKQLPPTLHYKEPNPNIDFENSPFYVNTKLTDWLKTDSPRRAGISAFGVGGTNAHVILQESPAIAPTTPDDGWYLLPISAKTDTALAEAQNNLTEHLLQHPEITLADVAYTLQVGRQPLSHRSITLTCNTHDAVDALCNSARTLTGICRNIDKPPLIAYLFPGQGTQYVNMGRDLYEQEPIFREAIDQCAAFLADTEEFDLFRYLYPAPDTQFEAVVQLKQTMIAQPILLVVEYALAQLWKSWGVQPQALLGHSVGEYTAACLAGVFSLEDALTLIMARGRLMQSLPSGAMLAIPMSETEIAPLLHHKLSLAAVNGPSRCVVSGECFPIQQLEQQLQADGIQTRRLETSHAFHSGMMISMQEPFGEQVRRITLNPPVLPCLSNVSGTWCNEQEMLHPEYWTQHIVQPVRFNDCLTTLFSREQVLIIELGPGNTFSRLAMQHPNYHTGCAAIPVLPHTRNQHDDRIFALGACGKIWLAGVEPDWSAFHRGKRRQRIPLPTYPFARTQYWIEPGRQSTGSASNSPSEFTEDDVVIEQKLVLHPRPNISTIYTPPRSERERAIASVWQKVLGIQEIGVLDNFFELGGDSLLAIQVVDHLKRELHVEIPVVRLYDGLTIRSLTGLIDSLEFEQMVDHDQELLHEISTQKRIRRNEYQQRRRATSRKPGAFKAS